MGSERCLTLAAPQVRGSQCDGASHAPVSESCSDLSGAQVSSPQEEAWRLLSAPASEGARGGPREPGGRLAESPRAPQSL